MEDFKLISDKLPILFDIAIFCTRPEPEPGFAIFKKALLPIVCVSSRAAHLRDH
jgi:hypothetical protein